MQSPNNFDERWRALSQQKRLASGPIFTRVVRRFGRVGLTVLVTGLSAIVASVLSTATIFAVGHSDVLGLGLLLSLVIPTVIAPAAVSVISSLITELENTNRLLETAVETDPLTEGFNRRGFFARAAELTVKAQEPILVATEATDDTLGPDRFRQDVAYFS